PRPLDTGGPGARRPGWPRTVLEPSRQGGYSAVAGASFETERGERFVPGGEKVLCSLLANHCPRMPMITLTRLNGQPFVVNAEKIRYVEETPDTIVCTENGDRLMVKEPMQVVIKKAIEYARLIRRPITE